MTAAKWLEWTTASWTYVREALEFPAETSSTCTLYYDIFAIFAQYVHWNNMCSLQFVVEKCTKLRRAAIGLNHLPKVMYFIETASE